MTGSHPSSRWAPDLDLCRRRLHETLVSEGAPFPNAGAAALVARALAGMDRGAWAASRGVDEAVVAAAERGAVAVSPAGVTASRYAFVTMTPSQPTYTDVERARAAAWKQATTTLPADAKRPARYVAKDGVERGPAYEFCLPAEHASASLLPEVRAMALSLFAELGIPWHAGVDGGPSNHLLSSQVQCVNALGQMVADPSRIHAAFGRLLDIDEVMEIEPGRFLTFEYIGPTDFFDEAPQGQRVRGAHCTSVDAALLHRSSDGVVELVLVEWKYTESYRPRTPNPAKDAVRWKRYGAALTAPDGPVRADVLEFDDLLDEPLYQLVRQQLLAHELEKSRAHGADRVRVLHVSPPANDAYQASLRRARAMAIGATVTEVWQRLLRHPDRFLSVDSALFLDPGITSVEYCARYGPGGVARIRTADDEDVL
jgi:hypothetical protein